MAMVEVKLKDDRALSGAEELKEDAEDFSRDMSHFYEDMGASLDGNGGAHCHDGGANESVDEENGGPREASMFEFRINEPCSLSWSNIEYSLPLKKANEKRILTNCSGHLTPGKLLAILGPSGSGKTSLLNVLAGRVPSGGNLSGTVLMNGRPREEELFCLLTAYVIQDDALFSSLTVKETFLIAAELRLPLDIPLKKKQEVADKVIFELGLAKAKDTRIGNAFICGVSGGEKKRVNLGIEMMGNPSLIFLDEPTSGLDSFQAQNVVSSLKNLANNGRTIVMTIHQPRSSIFQMFSSIMLLSEGRTIFFGDYQDALVYFSRIGFVCPKNFNPADFYLDLISLDTRSAEREERTRRRIDLLESHCADTIQIAKHSGKWSADGHHTKMDGHDAASEGKKMVMERLKSTRSVRSKLRASKLHQFKVLFYRALTQVTSDKIPLIISVFTAVFFSVIVGCLYTNMAKNQRGIQDRMGALFFVVVNNAFGQMFAILNVFTTEKLIVQREFAARAYTAFPYYSSKLIAEQPFRLIGPLIFCCISYPIIGLNPKFERFLIFVLIVLLLAIAAQTLGIFLGCISKNEEIASNVSPLATVILLLFGGFYVNKDTIPDALSWIEYISHIQWAFTALCINEFEGQSGWKCDGFEAESNLCDVDGEQILHRLSMSDQTVWEPIVSQFLLICLLHTGAYFSLVRLKPTFKSLKLAVETEAKALEGNGH